MTDIILQYVLVVLLIVGLSYFVYLIKDKGIIVKEDYYGITHTILRALIDSEASSENVKRILRAVFGAVTFVEANYKNEPNDIKEEKALILAREAVEALDFESTIDEESLRYLIRINAVLMPEKDNSYLKQESL